MSGALLCTTTCARVCAGTRVSTSMRVLVYTNGIVAHNICVCVCVVAM